MKKIILLSILAVGFGVASCQPCEQKCAFKEGDEVEIKVKAFYNNDGIITDVDHHMDCSCYYTVSHSNMINIEYEREYDETELKAK